MIICTEASLTAEPSFDKRAFVVYSILHFFVANLRQKLRARSSIVKDVTNTSYNTEMNDVRMTE